MSLELKLFAKAYFQLCDWNWAIERSGVNPYEDWTADDWRHWEEIEDVEINSLMETTL